MKRSPAVTEITCFGLFLQIFSLLVSSVIPGKSIFIKLPLFPQTASISLISLGDQEPPN